VHAGIGSMAAAARAQAGSGSRRECRHRMLCGRAAIQRSHHDHGRPPHAVATSGNGYKRPLDMHSPSAGLCCSAAATNFLSPSAAQHAPCLPCRMESSPRRSRVERRLQAREQDACVRQSARWLDSHDNGVYSARVSLGLEGTGCPTTNRKQRASEDSLGHVDFSACTMQVRPSSRKWV